MASIVAWIKNMKVSSFDSSDNIQKTESWSYCAISNNESSSVTNERQKNDDDLIKNKKYAKIRN